MVQEDLEMKVNLARRVSNIPLKRKEEVYYPIFEAISNSLDAIDENNGLCEITIEVIRDETQLTALQSPKDAPIKDIEITDTGSGFTEENLQSFNELDSERKQLWGGKGVGRLLWLKTFDQVEIDSVYEDGKGRRYRRSFFFKLPKGITNIQSRKVDSKPFETKIKLQGYKREFEEYFRRKRFGTDRAIVVL